MDELTAESRDRWNAVSAGWARRRAFFAEVAQPVTDHMVALLAPRTGERVLELAAGPGEVGFAISPLLGESGQLVSSDFAPEMVDAARERAVELDLRNIRFDVLDAQDTGLAEGSFDAIVSRFGYMLVADPSKAFRETRRLLAEDGRAVFAVWADRSRNDWGTAAPRALVELGHLELPDRYAPGPFALDDPERLESMLDAAGLDMQASEDVAISWRFSSLEDWWAVQRDLSSVLSTAMASLSPAQISDVQTRAFNYLTPASASGGLALPGLARVVLLAPDTRG